MNEKNLRRFKRLKGDYDLMAKGEKKQIVSGIISQIDIQEAGWQSQNNFRLTELHNKSFSPNDFNPDALARHEASVIEHDEQIDSILTDYSRAVSVGIANLLKK